MKRTGLWASAVLLASTSVSLAQLGGLGGAGVPGGIPGGGALGGGLGGGLAQPGPNQQVNVSNKCCSIWDFLGVKQFGRFIDQNLFKTRLGQAVGNVLRPVARPLFGPSLLNDKFAKEPGVMGLASKIKKDQMKVPLKLQAIKFLAQQDCKCYPEITDELLKSLDDCSEEVRFAALDAIHSRNRCCDNGDCGDTGCGACGVCNGKGCGLCKHKKKECGPCPSTCGNCQCEKKVIDRLNELLIERDDHGCLKESSARVRMLAQLMIEECLSCRQPPPCGEETVPVEAAPEKPQPEAKPPVRVDPKPADVRPDPKPTDVRPDPKATAPKNSTAPAPAPATAPMPTPAKQTSNSIRGIGPSYYKPTTAPQPVPTPAINQGTFLRTPQDGSPFEGTAKPSPIQTHTSGYRGIFSNAPAEVVPSAPRAGLMQMFNGTSAPTVVEPKSAVIETRPMMETKLAPTTKVVETVVDPKAEQSRKHLLGEIFGY